MDDTPPNRRQRGLSYRERERRREGEREGGKEGGKMSVMFIEVSSIRMCPDSEFSPSLPLFFPPHFLLTIQDTVKMTYSYSLSLVVSIHIP